MLKRWWRKTIRVKQEVSRDAIPYFGEIYKIRKNRSPSKRGITFVVFYTLLLVINALLGRAININLTLIAS